MPEYSPRLLVRWTVPVALLFAVAAVARATVVFDNFDATGGFHPTDNISAIKVRLDAVTHLRTLRRAVQFTVTGGDLALTSIALPISTDGPTPGDYLRVRLTSDDAGTPGTTLEVLSEDQGIWPQISNPFTTITT